MVGPSGSTMIGPCISDFVKLCEGTYRKMRPFDTGRYYEVVRLGPIFLAWNMTVAKNEKGKVTKQKYKIKKEKVIFTSETF